MTPFKIRKFEDFGDSEPRGIRFMTYNVLSQGLCRPDRYPTNGAALQWEVRFRAMTREIEVYKPDILLLQEVDTKYLPQWDAMLERCGLTARHVGSPNRKFGILTAWRKEKYSFESEKTIFYDKLNVRNLPKLCNTECVGYVAVLNGLDADAPDVVVANTHLFYHPDADYERCRQLLILMQAVKEMAGRFDVNRLLLGGDFNATNASAPIMLLHRQMKPGNIPNGISNALKASMAATDFGRASGLLPFNTNLDACISTLSEEFADLKMGAMSLYTDYKLADPENVSAYGGPHFTNWTEDFIGAIDYLMEVYCVPDVGVADLVTTKILLLPNPSEMGPEPNSLPRIGYYPSDHLALMVEVSWNSGSDF